LGKYKVYQYTLSSAWDLSTATYTNQSVSTGPQDPNPRHVYLDPSGSKLYITGTGTDYIYEYSLSTPWDISTLSYDSTNFSISGQDGSVMSEFFNNDMTKMYVTGYDSHSVYEITFPAGPP